MKRYCNRCNAEKRDNSPCPKCGCQEFRIVEDRKERPKR